MNKLGIVLGVAAVAVVSGCKDPNYNKTFAPTQNEAKNAATSEESVQQTPAEAQSIETVQGCTCPPGTKHEVPCACGAADCLCVVTPKAVAPKPAEPEFTVYIVQNGDYLAKISKKFNITIKSIKSLNNLKSDMIRVGQKLKIPGKVDVGEQKTPVVRKADASKPAAAPASFTGATKEYVVKGGDSLGAIAYASGISIRQLKAMNGLSKDSIRVGQKLKIPAEKVQKAEKKAEKKPVVAAKPVETKPATKVEPAKPAETKPAEPPAPAVEEKPVETAPATDDNVAPVDVAPAAPATVDYTVKEGEDIMSIVVKNGLEPSVIRELNHMGENDEIVPGQVIKLPADVQQ